MTEVYNIIIISFLLIITIIFFQKKFNFLLNKASSATHKTFIKNTNLIPLSGGLYLLTVLLVFKINYFFNVNLLFLIALFLLGFFSDYKNDFSPKLRLMIQLLIILFFLILNKIYILDVRIDLINEILKNKTFSYMFLSFCLLVLINGSNFIDGINLSASGYYLLVVTIIFNLYLKYNLNIDVFYMKILIISLIVFIIFNFFQFSILGDNGIYILSFIIGILVIELINKNNFISPYFAVNLLWYPCFENLFSIIRKSISKKNPLEPDNMHLHHLLYFFLKKKLQYNSNNLTGILILFFNFLTIFLSSIFFTKTKLLILTLFFSVIFYLIIYFLLKKYFLIFSLRGNS